MMIFETKQTLMNFLSQESGVDATEGHEGLGVQGLGVLLDGLELLELLGLLGDVVLLGLDLAGLLQTLDEVALVPAVDLGDILEDAELAVGLHADVLESVRDNHTLLQVVGVRDTVEGLETVHGGGATGTLVRDHAANATQQDLVRGALMEGTFLRVVRGLLLLEGAVLELVTVQGTRDVGVLASDQNDGLAVEELLGDGGRQASQKVTLAVNDCFFGEHG